MPGGVMVARRTLDAEIGVQIPAGQQRTSRFTPVHCYATYSLHA